MKKRYNILILAIIILLLNVENCFSAIIGKVEKVGQDREKRYQVIDATSQTPIDKAKVRIPKQNYSTMTTKEGYFDLQAQVNSNTIMSVEKNGYKPFSMTINENTLKNPFVVGIEKSSPSDITIEKEMFHLGDDVFSDNSANAADFNTKSIGPFYNKSFKIGNIQNQGKVFLVIGSIIGIDTLKARDMGQSGVKIAYSSPVEVFFNSQKIAQIELNGDNQRIPIDSSLIMQNAFNEVTIKTGKNLFQKSRLDYDDIEFMNLSVEVD